MPKHCKVSDNIQVPNGYNKVIFGRKGYLYVKIDDQTVKILNPFDYIPDYVKLYKSKGEFKIKK